MIQPSPSHDLVLRRAADKCKQLGVRLTEKRTRILRILVESESPLSAYEIVDRFNSKAQKSIPPMSVYRILDFLIKEKLVHKLAMANKYVVCSHIVCCDEHKVTQFLICRQCHRTQEVEIPLSIMESLESHVTKAGFHLTNTQIELECLCDTCSVTAP